MKHLAIFKGEGAQNILTGKKTIESRFSKAKIAPFGMVSSGDLVYIKESGGQIIGQFKVQRVVFYDGVDREEIKEKYGEEVPAGAKYGTLIFIGESSRFITSPIKPVKRDLRGWMLLD